MTQLHKDASGIQATAVPAWFGCRSHPFKQQLAQLAVCRHVAWCCIMLGVEQVQLIAPGNDELPSLFWWRGVLQGV